MRNYRRLRGVQTSIDVHPYLASIEGDGNVRPRIGGEISTAVSVLKTSRPPPNFSIGLYRQDKTDVRAVLIPVNKHSSETGRINPCGEGHGPSRNSIELGVTDIDVIVRTIKTEAFGIR